MEFHVKSVPPPGAKPESDENGKLRFFFKDHDGDAGASGGAGAASVAGAAGPAGTAGAAGHAWVCWDMMGYDGC